MCAALVSPFINITVLVIMRLCVLCGQICQRHTLYLQGILDLKHVLSEMVNGLMGHVMKVGLKHAAFNLKINLMPFMHAWNYVEVCKSLNFRTSYYKS